MATAASSHKVSPKPRKRKPEPAVVMLPFPCSLRDELREQFRAELNEYARNLFALCRLMSVEAAEQQMYPDYGLCVASRVRLQRHERTHGCWMI